MKIANALTFLSFGPGAFGYVIRAYTDNYCKGDSTKINVWGNTCRDQNVPDDVRSVKLVGYGAPRQRAHLYDSDSCTLDRAVKEFWVDGGSVKEGECVNVHAIIKSFASWSR